MITRERARAIARARERERERARARTEQEKEKEQERDFNRAKAIDNVLIVQLIIKSRRDTFISFIYLSIFCLFQSK